jgi:hypothetical protein
MGLSESIERSDVPLPLPCQPRSFDPVGIARYGDSIGTSFPAMTMDSARYKIFGIATNMDGEGEMLIN